MESNDAKTKNSGRRRNKRIDQDQQIRLGETRGDSPVDGKNESRATASYSEGGNPPGRHLIIGDTPSGKILQRLDKLEETHYRYVHAHQTRLQARLDESKQLEEQFRREAADLRQQILELAAEEHQPHTDQSDT